MHEKSFLVICLSPTSTPLPRRLATGMYIKKTCLWPIRMLYEGRLTIENGLDLDAVAVLQEQVGLRACYLAVYVKSHDTCTIDGIPDGTYELFFVVGEDWDGDAGTFTRRASHSLFRDPFSFTTTPTQATTWSVTLHAVAGYIFSCIPGLLLFLLASASYRQARWRWGAGQRLLIQLFLGLDILALLAVVAISLAMLRPPWTALYWPKTLIRPRIRSSSQDNPIG